VLDRLFLVQYDRDRVWLLRSPDLAAGLGEAERGGCWNLVRADFPDSAFAHAGQVISDDRLRAEAGCLRYLVMRCSDLTWASF
jgi:hypothetical protein